MRACPIEDLQLVLNFSDWSETAGVMKSLLAKVLLPIDAANLRGAVNA